MRADRVMVATVALVALSGCSAARTGSPVAGSPSSIPETTIETTTVSSAPPSSSHRLLPPRPRELSLTGVDPCNDVLTRSQLHELAYDLGYERAPYLGEVSVDNGRTCTYSSTA